MGSDFSLGLATQDQEISLQDVPLQGSLPDWLHGTLVRNGPGGFDFGDSKAHH